MSGAPRPRLPGRVLSRLARSVASLGTRQVVVLATLMASVAVVAAVGVGSAEGGFTATINNSSNSLGSGTLVLQEAPGGSTSTCLSTSTDEISSDSNTCGSGFNLFGGLSNAEEGTTSTATVAVENVGTLGTSTLTLTPASCTATANTATSPYYGEDTTGFCGEVEVTVAETAGSTTTCVYPTEASGTACPALSSSYTLQGLGSSSALSLGSLASNATDTFTFTIGLSSGATNADQGLAATVPLTWELAQ